MKFDMHCHTKEGSLDGKISVAEYIKLLKAQGFNGMLITDHDSYNGFRYYRDNLKEKLRNFVVLKGIEYDTIDAGHILVILPEDVKLPLMECRGLPVKLLIDIVHKYGGILGPAHPCGERHLSFTRTRAYKKNPEIMRCFDFLEAFNACESTSSNMAARRLAFEYRLPMIMLMYGKEASNRKQEIDRQHHTIPKQKPKDKPYGNVHNRLFRHG